MSEISKLLAEVESLKNAVAALTQSSQPDGEKSGGQPDATPEASSIKKAQPKQGLELGSLQTGTLQTGSLQTGSLQRPDERSLVAEPDASELAERQIAANYSEDLSGTNGPLNQFRAVREIAETTAQAGFDELTISSADGASVFGDWPFMTLKAGRKGEVPADPENIPETVDCRFGLFIRDDKLYVRAGTVRGTGGGEKKFDEETSLGSIGGSQKNAYLNVVLTVTQVSDPYGYGVDTVSAMELMSASISSTKQETICPEASEGATGVTSIRVGYWDEASGITQEICYNQQIEFCPECSFRFFAYG